MLSLTIIKSIQVYGIVIVISMAVAVLIKTLVFVTGRVEKKAQPAHPQPAAQQSRPALTNGVSDEVVAAISAALALACGTHRILHIAESGRAWSSAGRSAQHSHQPRH